MNSLREIRPHCGSCSVAMEITKEEAQSLRMKMRNAKLYLKEALVVYGFHPLEARLPELASKLERLDCSHLFNSEHRSKLSTDYSAGERLYKIVEVHFAEMTGATTKQASVTTLHVKNNASHHKHRQLSWYSLSLFNFLSIISALVIYCNVFYRRIR